MEALLVVEFDSWDELSESNLATLRAIVGDKVCVRETDGKTYLDYGCGKFQMTLTEAMSVGVKFHVLEVTKLTRIDDIKPPEVAGPAPVNERCNVIVAGVSMLHINETLLMNDACTDALQDHLNQGWRILAICVQPDQRRPDYVLGRAKP